MSFQKPNITYNLFKITLLQTSDAYMGFKVKMILEVSVQCKEQMKYEVFELFVISKLQIMQKK